MKETKAQSLDKPTSYGKEQLLKSGKLNALAARALLREDREYNVEEAQKLIGEFLEREVK